MAMQLAALVFFSWMAWIMTSAALWIVAGAASFFVGWYWFDLYPDNLGIAFSVFFVVYGIICWSNAIKALFFREK